MPARPASTPSTTPRARRSPRPASARALTLIEVVLAVLLLGLAATAVMSSVAFVLGTEGRGRKIAAAFEVANRLVLQQLDDPKLMPPPGSPVEYNDQYTFAWDMELTPVTMQLSARSAAAAPANSQSFLSRFKIVTINIYEAQERSAGGVSAGEHLATLSRVYDPTAVRNPDAMDRVGTDRIREMLNEITGGVAAQGAPTGERKDAGGTRSGGGNSSGGGLGRSRDELPKSRGPSGRDSSSPGSRTRGGSR